MNLNFSINGMKNNEVYKLAKKPKEIFKVKIVCPHCNKRMIVKKTKKELVPSVQAEYEEKVTVEKDTQKTIDESSKKKK